MFQSGTSTPPRSPGTPGQQCGNELPGELEALKVMPEDRCAAGFVGRVHPDHLVEAAGSAQGLVDVLWPIRRTDRKDLAAILKPVEQGEQLGHHRPLVLRISSFAERGEAVDLVEGFNRTCILLGLIVPAGKFVPGCGCFVILDREPQGRDERSATCRRS